MKSVLDCGGRALALASIFLVVAVLTPSVLAEEEAQAKEPPPLPLHQFEGNGGAFTTLQAYLVNPAPEGEVFGLPSIGYIHVNMGHGRHLECATATWTLWQRLELGVAWNGFDAGDLGKDVLQATGVDLGTNRVDLYHVNARAMLLGDPGPKEWWPALTLGAHFKHNDTIRDLDRDLGGGLSAIGVENNQGFDFTLVATKYFAPDWLPVPVCASATLRATKAAHVGLLGFTEYWTAQGEFGVCSPIADNIWLAAEYKMKPDEYDAVPGLIEKEEDWWTIDVAYVANSHLTVALGYGHFGWILNHKANFSFGIAVKYEF